ncbi:MAG: LLM class flavin-dependent oxidoreductase, partial [Candidatus Binatia bacterium]
MKVRVGFGFGISAATGMSADAFWTAVDTLEAQGWDSLWLSERATGDVAGPIAGLAAVAGRTRKLKLGHSVLVVPGRNPLLLAKELATIDLLSAGRFVAAFGLGAEEPREREAYGVVKGEAGAMTEEAVILMKRLWSEDRVTHEGRFYRVNDVALRPRPHRRPHPDVWFGGHSKAALRRVARLGEGWLPSFLAPAEYAGMVGAIRAGATEAGRAIDDEHYGALLAYLGPESSAAAETFLAAIRARRPEVEPRELVATSETDLREKLERFVEAGASKFVIVPLTAPRDWESELAKLH